jgi:hypothetical protein
MHLLPVFRDTGGCEGPRRRAGTVDANLIGIARALEAGDAGQRTDMIRALGTSGDARCVKLLFGILDLNSPYTSSERAAAAHALGELGDARAVSPLLRALRGGDDQLRREAASALGAIGSSALDPLQRALLDNNQKVRVEAAQNLGAIGAPALEPLLKALQHYDPLVRAIAAQALGRIGRFQAVRPLLQVLDWDDDTYVRQGAAAALGRISGSRGLPQRILAETSVGAPERFALLETLWRTRHVEGRALLPFLMPTVAHFCEVCLTDADPAVRERARTVLEFRTLARPSVRETGEQTSLLRPASGPGAIQAPQELLRGSAAPEETLDETPPKPGWWARRRKGSGREP